MLSVEYFLLIGASLVLFSIAIAKLSDNLGIPTMVLFILVGMLAGSEGPGGIFFDNAELAQSIGTVALILILFAGGLETRWRDARPALRDASLLATLGVALTAVIVGLFVTYVLRVPILQGMLIGAIISSTDAAAVFSVLRSKKLRLKGHLQPLLELESGGNDPMAVFLVVGLIQMIMSPGSTPLGLASQFVYQMSMGGVVGFVLAKVMIIVFNRLRLAYEGIYPVLALAFVSLIYGATTILGGSGFLAVFIAGVVGGACDFVYKRSMLRFFDGMAWLSQITMFVTLGLLVFPSQIIPVAGVGVLISVVLIAFARPLSVFAVLALSGLGWKEKAFVSWIGLRGAVPIILATFPLLAGVTGGSLIFNLVFFIVVTSALLQGWSIPFAAKVLEVQGPAAGTSPPPIELTIPEKTDSELIDLIIPFNSAVHGKSIVDMGLPEDSLIILISDGDKFVVPGGSSVLHEGDTILVLSSNRSLEEVKAIISRQSPGT